MTIEMLTYLYVAPRSEVGAAELREHDEATDQFLSEHFAYLTAKAESASTPCATFREREAQDLFAKLEKGDGEAFLEAADMFTKRLVEEMDGRASAGLLVFARFVEDGVTSAVVLKLDVVSAHAGVLRQLADGPESLGTVRDVLDSPGKLQKGLVTPDLRDGSDVFVSDRLTKTSEYFVRAFGVTIESRPVEGVLSMVEAVLREVPEAAIDVVKALPAIEGGPLRETLDHLVEQVPKLEPKRQIIEESLRTLRRPVRSIDTSAGCKLKVIVDSITIEGPAVDVNESVSCEPEPTQGWTTTIRSTSEPRWVYNK